MGLSEFEQDLVIVALTAVVGLVTGGGGAYLTRGELGRAHSRREDRKYVLDHFLPVAIAKAQALAAADEDRGDLRALPMPDLQRCLDQIGGLVERTSTRDRRVWRRATRRMQIPTATEVTRTFLEPGVESQFDPGPTAGSWILVELAYFRRYLNRQFDPWYLRTARSIGHHLAWKSDTSAKPERRTRSRRDVEVEQRALQVLDWLRSPTNTLTAAGFEVTGCSAEAKSPFAYPIVSAVATSREPAGFALRIHLNMNPVANDEYSDDHLMEARSNVRWSEDYLLTRAGLQTNPGIGRRSQPVEDAGLITLEGIIDDLNEYLQRAIGETMAQAESEVDAMIMMVNRQPPQSLPTD